MLTGLNHLTLAVADLSRSVAFYSGLLDFKLRARWDNGAYLLLGELWLCLSVDTRRILAINPDYTHFAFSVEQADFAAFVDRIRRNGVREWKDNRSEGDSVYFLDPDEHQLEAHVGDLEGRLAACRLQPYAGMEIFD
ncbi:fosfomycin resistance glutathione transferase [Ralstonia pickettii]|uniref:fosfomycin resistance glutathione transferase n=1 Tax=Ralstonia pickettii TaxID=329 RepID=UPI0015BEDC12|nr:fosfomycin resistance glutathione transferase [Ralstonia pickettii]NWK46443.1 fosfomycin resistance glutathione transferase [Ralstonia pickettii]